MSKISLEGNVSGSGTLTIAAPNTSTNRTLTLPDNTGTIITTGSTFAGTGPAVNVWKSSSQNISASTWTKATFDQEEFDTNSNFASSTFTPTVAGYYQVNASANLSNTTNFASSTQVGIYKNGSLYKRASWNAAGGNTYINDTTQCISTVTYMNGTTDYLEVYCWEAAGGTPQIVGDADKRTSFSAALVRAA
jgi:hypothetical protein